MSNGSAKLSFAIPKTGNQKKLPGIPLEKPTTAAYKHKSEYRAIESEA